jgi:hypothetical protein
LFIYFRYQQLTDTAIHEPENKNNYFTDCTYGNLSGLICSFVFRNSLYRKPSKVSTKMEQEYNSRLCARSFFEGLSGVSLTEITLVPKDADTLLAKDENQCQHLAFAS